MTGQPTIHYLMVSYHWNFLAETALQSLPNDLGVYVIHNGKTQDRMRRFKSNKVIKQWFSPFQEHGAVIDSIWESSKLREIRECDVLIMLDHDCYFGDQFRAREKQLINAIMSGYLIAGGHMPGQYYLTIPMFAIKPIAHWPASWKIIHKIKTYARQRCDTGQYIAKLLPKALICNSINEPGFPLHWGSLYEYAHLHNFPDEEINKKKNFIRRYESLLCNGLWHPSEEELEEMSTYGFLKRAVESYRLKAANGELHPVDKT